jgi:flagellar motor switch protein FliM
MAPGGQEVAQAKLGQSDGMRAVRLQSAPMPDLQDLSAPADAGPLPLAVLGIGNSEISTATSDLPDAVFDLDSEEGGAD